MEVKPYTFENLVSYLRGLKETLGERRTLTSLRSRFGSMVDTIRKLDEMASSPNLSRLERDGITLVREYLKEASLKSYLGDRREAMPYVDRSLEVALTLERLSKLKGKGVTPIHPDELVEVDRIDGRPVYSVKRR